MSVVLGGFGNRQLGDRAEPGAERRRLRHAARQQPHRQAFVEAEDRGDGDHRGQTADGHDQRQHDLRQRVLLQAPEKLRADRIADREQEQVEERPAQQVGQFGLRQDADQDAGDQRPDHRPEADALEVKAADDGPEQDAQEQAQAPETRGETPRAVACRSLAPVSAAPCGSSPVRTQPGRECARGSCCRASRSSEVHSCSCIHASSSRANGAQVPGPFRRSAETSCVACAPAIVALTTSRPVWTPPVSASEALTRPRARRRRAGAAAAPTNRTAAASGSPRAP